MFRKIHFTFTAVTAAAAAFGMSPTVGVAQQATQYTTQDYAQAERFMSYNVNPLAYQGQVRARALDDGRFWYREVDATGATFILVDPAKGTRAPAFDQVMPGVHFVGAVEIPVRLRLKQGRHRDSVRRARQ